MVQPLDWEKNGIVALCNYCSKDVSFANMEEDALTSHIKGKNHVERSFSDQCIKLLRPPTPTPLMVMFKISFSGVWSLK